MLSTHSGIHMVSIEISFFDPHSLKNLITRFACYYSLRSYPQLALLVIRFLSLWGSKNEISLSTKWIPLFVANTVKQWFFVQQYVQKTMGSVLSRVKFSFLTSTSSRIVYRAKHIAKRAKRV